MRSSLADRAARRAPSGRGERTISGSTNLMPAVQGGACPFWASSRDFLRLARSWPSIQPAARIALLTIAQAAAGTPPGKLAFYHGITPASYRNYMTINDLPEIRRSCLRRACHRESLYLTPFVYGFHREISDLEAETAQEYQLEERAFRPCCMRVTSRSARPAIRRVRPCENRLFPGAFPEIRGKIGFVGSTAFLRASKSSRDVQCLQQFDRRLPCRAAESRLESRLGADGSRMTSDYRSSDD